MEKVDKNVQKWYFEFFWSKIKKSQKLIKSLIFNALYNSKGAENQKFTNLLVATKEYPHYFGTHFAEYRDK